MLTFPNIACAFVFAAAVVVVDVAVGFFAPWGMLQRYPGTLILVSHDRSLRPDDPTHRKKNGVSSGEGHSKQWRDYPLDLIVIYVMV